MSHIADLIAKHCPNGVNEKLISDVATLERGKYISKKTAIPGEIPVIAGGRGPAYWHNESNRTGELLTVAGSGAYAGFVQYWDSPVFVSDAFSIATNPQINTRFLYHWLKNKQDFLHSLKKGSGVPHVYPKDIAKLKIPVPPLEVQNEIVRILDSYSQLETDLESELEAELEARRKQYEYYRASLFDSAKLRSTSTELALGKLGAWSGGGTPSKSVSSYWIEGYLWVSPKDMKQTYIFQTEDQISEEAVKSRGLRVYPSETILLVARSGILKHSLPVGILEKQATVNQDIKALRVNNNVTSKYALYALQNYSQDILRTCHKAGGSVDSLDMKKFLAFQIPVPPLAEQERIVAILDKFDALVNDLSSGLPAEIEARRKQYEYYRDRLLIFTPSN